LRQHVHAASLAYARDMRRLGVTLEEALELVRRGYSSGQ
jgi:hypothetical protein